jgi:hypothetical protein
MFCAKCRIKFYKMRKVCDVYNNLGAGVSELENTEQEEYDSSHELEAASASSVATEILNSSLQAVREAPIKKEWLQEKTYSKNKI